MTDYVLGILGGMGPEATAYFFQRLLKATPAQKDADHIKTIVYSNPHIPDRTQAILGTGKSPAVEMIKTALELEKVGANGIFIPCVTAHYFVEEVQNNIHVPIWDLLKILHMYLKTHHSDIKKVGILCTTGTRRSKIFDREIDTFQLVYPNEAVQEAEVMEAIYGERGIKAGCTTGEASQRLTQAALHLKEKGAQVIVMGCTEIPLAFQEDSIDIPAINIMKIAAEHIIERIYK